MLKLHADRHPVLLVFSVDGHLSEFYKDCFSDMLVCHCEKTHWDIIRPKRDLFSLIWEGFLWERQHPEETTVSSLWLCLWACMCYQCVRVWFLVPSCPSGYCCHSSTGSVSLHYLHFLWHCPTSPLVWLFTSWCSMFLSDKCVALFHITA